MSRTVDTRRKTVQPRRNLLDSDMLLSSRMAGIEILRENDHHMLLLIPEKYLQEPCEPMYKNRHSLPNLIKTTKLTSVAILAKSSNEVCERAKCELS